MEQEANKMMKTVQNIAGVAGTVGACVDYTCLVQGCKSTGRPLHSECKSCRFKPYRPLFRGIAQSVEHEVLNLAVAGSTPAAPVCRKDDYEHGYGKFRNERWRHNKRV